MTSALLEIAVYFLVLLLLARPLGEYMARVYQGKRTILTRLLEPVERGLYRLAGVDARSEMDWRVYAASLLVFNFVGFLALYALLRAQAFLPMNPRGFRALDPDLTLNAAVSFTSNTNWQNYGGETTLSHLSQMLGMTVQNFLSAATGMSVLIALTRGLSRQAAEKIGNFWVDLTRGTLYVLLPLSFILALFLASQGVVQTLKSSVTVPLLDPVSAGSGTEVSVQTIAVGPVASQIAIKQLGTNGGGFFSANASHPFENPTPLTNFAELLAILLIPASLCLTFGRMVGDTRQGRAIFVVMSVLFLAFLLVPLWFEQQGNPLVAAMGVDQTASAAQSGGNMEGKEVRVGVVGSALWATATTAASNGSVNSMHDSYTPLGGLAPMLLMQLGEVVFGGVGAGLYGMVAFIVAAVFVAGLMVGRTPEYLGKKIEVFEMKMATLVILLPPVVVLLSTALAVATEAGRAAAANQGPHGFSEILYAFSSQGNNNGSAFAGFNGDTPLLNTAGALAMLVGRYWLIVPTLAMAGSLARKRAAPPSAGTLPTHTPLFGAWLIAVTLLIGALSFFPTLALGPIVEHLLLLRAAAF